MFKVKVMDLPRFSLGGMESINFRSRSKLAATPIMNRKRQCTEVKYDVYDAGGPLSVWGCQR